MAIASPTLRRGLFRFSVRGLLLLALLAGLGIKVAQLTHERIREQGIAVEALSELGCDLVWDGSNRSPDALERLRKLLGESVWRNVIALDSHYGQSSRLTDAGMVHVQGLKHLEVLTLYRTKVTDAGLVNIECLAGLEALSLRRTKITDAGLLHIRGLSNLADLDLSQTLVTDAGVLKLQQDLPNCKIRR